jgi:hypothetical protein
MPHRPEEGLGSSISGVNSSAVYTPPRVAESTAAAIMRQQGAHNNYGGARSPSGVVTPVVKSKHWSMMPGIDARTSNKSSDSTDRSTGTNDDSRSIATLATEDEREVTASALMMVAQAAEREHYLSAVVPSSSTSTGSSSSTVPLKKRKKQMDIIRRQEQQDNEEDHHHHHHESSSNTDDNNNNKDDHTTEQNHPYDERILLVHILTIQRIYIHPIGIVELCRREKLHKNYWIHPRYIVRHKLVHNHHHQHHHRHLHFLHRY